MNKRWFNFQQNRNISSVVVLIICTAFFASGIIVGFFAAALIPDNVIDVLSDYIQRYAGMLREDSYAGPEFWTVLKSTVLPPLIVFFLGFSIFGFVFIPMIATVKGFLLSFSISAVIKTLGVAGWPVALGVFGISNIIEIPCFIIVTVAACMASFTLFGIVFSNRPKSDSSLLGRVYLFRCTACFLILIVTSLLETYLLPYLAALLAKI